MMKPKTILITGASSGIGKALAESYAEAGTTLLLTGRDMGRLTETAQICTAKGATVETAVIDVTEATALKTKILSWDDAHPIDLVIANAGISGGMKKGQDADPGRFDAIIATNINGAFNTVNPLIPRMIARQGGHIALMSSLAGFRGMPTAPAYSVSKVAVRAYGDALRPILAEDNIDLTLIHPGFVKTPLTDANDFPMPFLMEVEEAAMIIRRGLNARKPVIAFPWLMYALCWLLGVLPRRIGDLILSHAPKKI